MSIGGEIHGTRQFHTLEEITSVEGFEPDCPIDLETYAGLLGWYSFAEGLEVKCCVRKPNGNLCETKHRFGWVARLRSGGATIVGGDCAADKFGADSSIVGDINRAQNEIDRFALQLRVDELLSRREERLSAIEQVKRRLLESKEVLADFKEMLGQAAWTRLENMSRTGNNTVTVLGIVKARWDENGEKTKDRSEISITVGSINGTRICSPGAIPHILNELRSVESRLRSDGPDQASASASEFKRISAALADLPRLMDRANELIDILETFTGNDFAALCFAVPDLPARICVGRAVLTLRGADASNNKAKQLLHDAELGLREQYRVEDIRIG